MSGLVSRYGSLGLRRRPPFAVLARSIIAQQISTKAADTIRQRFNNVYGAPERVVASDVKTVLSLGLSEAKAIALRAVATAALDGELDALENLPDDAVRENLRKFKGVGPWTADMFLIFALARPDVWPLTDAGLRASLGQQYHAASRSAMEQVGTRFSPNRSIAALYLWKSLENTAKKAG